MFWSLTIFQMLRDMSLIYGKVMNAFRRVIVFLFCVFIVVSYIVFLKKLLMKVFEQLFFIDVCLRLFRICLRRRSDVSLMALLINPVTVFFNLETECSERKQEQEIYRKDMFRNGFLDVAGCKDLVIIFHKGQVQEIYFVVDLSLNSGLEISVVIIEDIKNVLFGASQKQSSRDLLKIRMLFRFSACIIISSIVL